MIIQDASTNKHVINDALSPLGDIDKLWVKELAEYARNITYIFRYVCSECLSKHVFFFNSKETVVSGETQ